MGDRGTNLGEISTLDHTVWTFNSSKRRAGKAVIRVRREDYDMSVDRETFGTLLHARRRCASGSPVASLLKAAVPI
jgi:hypothetical protein